MRNRSGPVTGKAAAPPPATDTRVALAMIGGLLMIWALVYLPWLGLLDLVLEEPRRALVTRTMLETGDFWVPQAGGEIYTAKPPLFNWLMALSATLSGGLDEWSARLPSVVGVAALMVLFVWGARRWLRPWALGFLGFGLLLAPEFLAKGRLAEIETTFTLLVAASLWAWLLLYRAGAEGWRLWVPPLTLVALAYLAKREPAVVFFYLAVGPFLLLQGRWRLLFQPGHLAAVAVAVAMVGGWLAVMASRTGWAVLWQTLQREVLERGFSERDWQDVVVHLLGYPWELMAAMLPFSFLIPLLAVAAVRSGVMERFGVLFTFAAVAVLANLPVYWLRGDVSVRYFLPMFPFALLIAAMVFDTLGGPLPRLPSGARRYLTTVRWAMLTIGAVLVALLLGSSLLPWIDTDRSALLPTLLAVSLAIAGGAALWRLARWASLHPLPALLAIFATVMLLFQALHYNLLLPDKARRVAEVRNAPLIVRQVRAITGEGATLLAHDVPWALWYYSGHGVLHSLPKDARPPAGSWLLVHERSRDALVASGIPLQERARFSYAREALLLGQVVPAREMPTD
jgi:4-amino-4-deoxy-L-arabinose transferase-like glycosyltransferase